MTGALTKDKQSRYKVARYHMGTRLDTAERREGYMYSHPDGHYVMFKDHQRIMRRLRALIRKHNRECTPECYEIET